MNTNILTMIEQAEVEWKPLGEVVHSIKTGLNPRQFFKLNTSDATNYYVTIRELKKHKIVFSEKTDKLNDDALILCNNRSNLEVGDVLFSGTGTIGEVALITEKPKNWNIKEGVYSIKPIQEILFPKFLLYLFETETIRSDFLSKSAGGTVKSVPMKELAKVKIPIPPLELQKEIVKRLDILTELEATLEAELILRKKQYQYYQDFLLSESELVKVGFEWKSLGEVATKIYSGGTPKTDILDYWENGNIPWMSSGEVNLGTVYQTEKFITELGLQNSSAKIVPRNSVVIALAGQGKTRGKVARIRLDLTTNQSLASIVCDENIINPDYVFHFLNTQYENLRQISSGNGARGGLNLQMISSYKIPIPPLETQAKIVAILDKFDRLTNSITDGLPKEIELRRKQYEYYRELLLGFENDTKI